MYTTEIPIGGGFQRENVGATEDLAVLDPDVWEGLSVLPADAIADIIDMYVGSSFVLLATIRTAASAEEPATLRRLLHELQGSSASLGLLTVAKQCAALEQQIQAGTLTNIPAALHLLEVTHAQGERALGKRRAMLLDQQR